MSVTITSRVCVIYFLKEKNQACRKHPEQDRVIDQTLLYHVLNKMKLIDFNSSERPNSFISNILKK